MQRITVFCFAASYAVALALELVQLLWPRRVQRVLSVAFGGAGLLAHALFLAFHAPSLATQYGSLLLLAFIVAVFYFYGTVHYRRLAWAVFVLPLVLGLIALAELAPDDATPGNSWLLEFRRLRGETFWAAVHGYLLELAAVGVCVGFVASIMYLLQSHRLKAKIVPRQGLRLLSLERLEEMNRRALNWAFPLLTAGLLVGIALMRQRVGQLEGWTDPRVVGTSVLWLVFAIMLYLRYGYHLRGRRVALLTIVAFLLLLCTLASAHTAVQGGGR